MLDHEARRPRLQRAPRIGRILVHGQEDNLDVGIMLLEQAQRIDAIELGHRDVGHDNVRTQFFGRRQQRVAVFEGSSGLQSPYDGHQPIARAGDS